MKKSELLCYWSVLNWNFQLLGSGRIIGTEQAQARSRMSAG
jgi:hypothetical protein